MQRKQGAEPRKTGRRRVRWRGKCGWSGAWRGVRGFGKCGLLRRRAWGSEVWGAKAGRGKQV